MRVYILTREENGKTAVWSPFERLETASAMLERHYTFRVENGATLIRDASYTPSEVVEGSKVRVGGSENHPIMVDAPECICCVIREVEVRHNSIPTIYRIAQHPIIK